MQSCLPNRADCASRDQISSTQVYYSNIRKGVDPDNFTQPVSTVPEFDGILSVDPRSTKTLSFKVKSNEIWDDNLDFFDARLRTTFADYTLSFKDFSIRPQDQIYCTEDTMNGVVGACKPYAVYTWQSSGETQVIKRTYSKFFGSLGEVGGTTEMVILFAMLLYTGYNNFFVKRYLENQLFCKQNGGHEKISQIFKHSYSPQCKTVKERIQRTITKLKEENQGAGIESIRSIKKRAKEELQRDEKRVVMKAIDKNIQNNEDGVKLYQRLNRLEVLERILFEEHDKILMPIALINIIRNKERDEENDKLGLSKGKKLESKIDSEQGIMSIEEAYESLESFNPTSGVKQLIKSFILENLPSGVKRLSEMRKGGRKAKTHLGGSGGVLGRHRDSEFSLPEPPSPAPIIDDLGESRGRNHLGREKTRPPEVNIQGLITIDDNKEQIRFNSVNFEEKGRKRESSIIIRNKRSKLMRKAPPVRKRLSQGINHQRMLQLKDSLDTELDSLKMMRIDGLSQIIEEG